MKHSDISIFEMRAPPMWRILGANALLWVLAIGFWWRTFQIDNIESIPSSRRFGPLSFDIALLLGVGFFVCACWAVLLIKKARWHKWPANVRLGLLGAIAGLVANAATMMAAAQRISQVGS